AVTAMITTNSGTVSNAAAVTPPVGMMDPTPGNTTFTDTATVVPVSAVAELSITKTNGVSSVNAGGSSTYTVTVTNNGPSEVSGAARKSAVQGGSVHRRCRRAVRNTGGGESEAPV